MNIETLMPEVRALARVDHRALAREHKLHLEWQQITEMSAAGMTFGNHTVSHTPLGQIEPDACRAEIKGAIAALEHLPGAGQTLAYPFGSRREETRQIAIALGICSLLEVEGVNRPLDPTRIGRIKVASHSVAALFARMEIVEPVKWRLKRWMRRLGLRTGLES
jgi:peptidoglycan/xylan/chitin deacetylase (PgdA/CDA1 family)